MSDPLTPSEGDPRRQADGEETKALHLLFNIASMLTEPGAFTALATRMLEEVSTVLEVDSANLRMPDADQTGLRVVASVGSALQPLGTFRSFGDSRTGRVFQLGKPIIAHDYEVNHRGGPDRGRRRRSGYEAQSVAWFPVKAAGRTVGVLAVDTAAHDHFTAERVRLLTAVADGIGTFIENATLREEAQRHVEELESTLVQLRATQHQLVQSEKLAAVGTLISGVAHEINNPLNNIVGRVQLLQQSIPDAAAQRGLQMARDECERAIRIVRNLLSFTREHKPTTSLVSVNGILGDVLELRSYEFRVGEIELRKKFQADLPEILADPYQLQQVFLNLVINAEQAMAETEGAALSITTERVGDALRIVVADNGPGIPKELLSKILDPFFTTKEVGAGTGLGLSVCYGIVKEHGGELRVESEQGHGATFTVELPLTSRG